MSEKGNMPKETGLDDKKKKALMRYMAVLFGVAFFLVLLTYFIQLRNSNQTISQLSTNNASALQNAENLQEENRTLNETVKTDREEMAKLETEVATQKLTIEHLEDEKSELASNHETLLEEAYEQVSDMEIKAKDTLVAYETLLAAEENMKKDALELVRIGLETLEQDTDSLGTEGKIRVESLRAAYDLAIQVTP